jgi:tRNA G46 methylase TrmB
MADNYLKHRFHGRRKGKALTAHRKSLLDVDFEYYKIIEPSLPFSNDNPTWLEIGFGNGEFLSHMSQNHADINFI